MICTQNIIRHSTSDCEYRKAELDLYDPSEKNMDVFYKEFPDFYQKHKEKAVKYAKQNNLSIFSDYQRPIVDNEINPILLPLPDNIYKVNKHITRRLARKPK